ncbi:MAG: FAD-dependent thymidylate synthase [Nostoc sp. NMS7]|uniref:FAD-dependent thymidylate synthase n=1 Tax=Nostoc sp. NMS7 TaxID=2815391 RepID=UPI0025F09917|nr:FAD-dependent thymidylate synthase [Nostoc sp. NMS7]MBN3949422.1 FAD-dependent thymidylate synthase [Nostoc sp. NMS7]
MKIPTLEDPHFIVELDGDASSPNPLRAIWRAQHQCVSETFVGNDCPIPNDPGAAIIKHQLVSDRGHYSVLRFAFAKFNIGGFPHDTIMQMRTHQGSAHLVQSNRFTYERFIKVAEDRLDVEKVFYFRPVGFYSDRGGRKYDYLEEERDKDKRNSIEACKNYAFKVQCLKHSYEHARHCLPQNPRQEYTLAGDIEATFHWLDQRTKADAELETRVLAEMVMQKLDLWIPPLAQWYRKERYGKAILAP